MSASNITFAKADRFFSTKRGRTAAEFAEKFGVSTNTAYYWMSKVAANRIYDGKGKYSTALGADYIPTLVVSTTSTTEASTGVVA